MEECGGTMVGAVSSHNGAYLGVQPQAKLAKLAPRAVVAALAHLTWPRRRGPFFTWPETGVAALDQLGHEGKPVTVLLPRSLTVFGEATFPAEAEETLYACVGQELESITGMGRGQAYYDCAVVTRDSKAQTVTAEIAASPKRIISDVIAQCQRAGVALKRVDVESEEGKQRPHFNLLRGTEMAAYERPGIWPVLAVLLFVSAIIFTCWANLSKKEDAIVHIEADINRLQRSVAKLSAQLDQSLAKHAAGPLKTPMPEGSMAIELLNAASSILPDDSWIMLFRLDGDVLNLEGYSNQPAALTRLFEASPQFDNVTAYRPGIQDDRIGAQPFALSMTVSDKGSPADS